MSFIRKTLYTLLFLFTVLLIGLGVPAFTETDGIEKASTSIFYNWIRNGSAYVFTSEFYISFSIMLIPAYALFDLLRRWIVGKNPTIRWRLWKNMVVMTAYWLYLIMRATNKVDFSLNLSLITLAGVIVGSLPFTLYNLGAKFLSAKTMAGYYLSGQFFTPRLSRVCCVSVHKRTYLINSLA